MPRFLPLFVLILTTGLLIAACERDDRPSPPPRGAAPAVATNQEAPPATPPIKGPSPPAMEASPAVAADKGPPPPTPPIKEDFEGEPTISLFARVGDFAPEDDDKEGKGYWLTFIDHLLRTSGPVNNERGRAFAFRGMKTINSLGFFTPLAVAPDTEYQVAYRVWGKLPDGTVTGVGYLEYNEFLWVGEQFPRSLSQKHFRGSREGLRLTGKQDGTRKAFTFRSGPETRMIHLVFFLEGETARDPIVIDDIEIVPATQR